jgi:UDP-GlcNAc:undecaprenyl-phosphate GlcNAc-1-phosphate transferase
MIISNEYLMVFALAMMGCVLVTPLVTHLAIWIGAIDRPDQFRRIHHGAIPRLGGLSLALGIAMGTILPHLMVSSGLLSQSLPHIRHGWVILTATAIVLIVGFVDDTRSIGPRVKLLGQTLAVVTLYLGGIQIEAVDLLGLHLDLTNPSFQFDISKLTIDVRIASLAVTMLWFLGCMNIWNLIDGMDGLASGVGLLVSGTLTLVAIHNRNTEVAVLAVSLAGSLAGFLLFNWHPACIFLGDSGALLIGLLIGVIGVEGSIKGPSTISILFPILAMGLPISDTAMAIFRRWVRNLPLSAADRRHVHHLLINFGLNPREAALMLYCFSGFLCGVVLLGVALRSEFLALILALVGCLAFLVVVTSRRDELTNLRGDFHERIIRGRQERHAAKLTWEAIQRIELCHSGPASLAIVQRTAHLLGCQLIQISWIRATPPFRYQTEAEADYADERTCNMSAAAITFRLSGGKEIAVTAQLELGTNSEVAADIVFRYLHRLIQALASRLEWLEPNGLGLSPIRTDDEHAYTLKPSSATGLGFGPAVSQTVASVRRMLGIKRRVVRPTGQLPFHGAKAVGAPTGFIRR